MHGYDGLLMHSVASLPQSRSQAPVRRVRLLVADDSKVARDAVLAYLRTRAELEVFAVCENGRLAVETALRQEPDVVLLDLQMPVMSGLEAAEIFRNCMPHVGVILTSMHDRLEVREACLAGGADAFIGKESLPEHFPAVLDRVLTLTRAPERHRRAPQVVSRPLTDLFAPARPMRRRGHPVPAGDPRSMMMPLR